MPLVSLVPRVADFATVYPTTPAETDFTGCFCFICWPHSRLILTFSTVFVSHHIHSCRDTPLVSSTTETGTPKSEWSLSDKVTIFRRYAIKAAAHTPDNPSPTTSQSRDDWTDCKRPSATKALPLLQDPPAKSSGPISVSAIPVEDW